MDDDFIEGRARDIRELATKADAFTRKRLLDLAERYERRLRGAPPVPARSAAAYAAHAKR